MTARFKPPTIPAAFFGIVLGLAGLGNAWRAAHQAWQLPALVGEALMALAAIVWALLVLLFVLKWSLARDEALGEAHHPVQCCFIGLAGVATMLIAFAALPYSRIAAEILFGLGAAFVFTATNGNLQVANLKLEVGRGDQSSVEEIALPAKFAEAPGGLSGDMGSNVLREYAARARDILHGTDVVPDFAFALRRHRLLAAIEEPARTGVTQK
jgi:hypothetical protein